MTVETLKKLATVPDGIKTDFATPSRFVFGTLRLIVNGISYESTHNYYGWTELDQQTIRIVTPPRATDQLQAFYTDADATEAELPDISGSPFAPWETCS